VGLFGLLQPLADGFSLQTKKAQSKKAPIKSFLALPSEESCALCSQSEQRGVPT
jgi:hypothetical protein